MFTTAGIRVYGTGPSQTSVHVLQAAAAQAGVDLTVWNTARLLGERKDGTYRNPRRSSPGRSCWSMRAPWCTWSIMPG